MPPEPSTPAPLGRAAAIVMLATGALALVLQATSLAFVAPIPAVLRHASLGAALLEVGLGYGMLRGRRAAWAFAVALEGTLLVVDLLALPELLRAGSVGAVSVALVALRVLAGGLAVAASRAF